MPGGAAAIKNPARIAYGALWAFDLLDHPAAQNFIQREVPEADTFDQIIERRSTPLKLLASAIYSMQLQALLGICTKPKSEGEAAILLEACVHDYFAHPEEQQLFSQHDLQKRSEAYVIEVIKNVAAEEKAPQWTLRFSF